MSYPQWAEKRGSECLQDSDPATRPVMEEAGEESNLRPFPTSFPMVVIGWAFLFSRP
ncbi:hypothetical protein GcC1_203042, partial [Golovinomyces cichoracearum]